MDTNLHKFLVDEVRVDKKVTEVNERNSTCKVGTHGSCVLLNGNFPQTSTRNLVYIKDARAVRPYRSSESPHATETP